MTTTAPRVGDTLTTAEDVFALPHRAIVRGWHGQAYLVLNGGVFAAGNEKRLDVVDLNIGKPFTVLYVPGEQPCRHCGSCDGPPSCPDCDHADRPSVTDNARAEAERRWPRLYGPEETLTYPREAVREHTRAGFMAGAEWAAGRAETTTATTEDALDSLPYFTFEDDDVAPDEEFVRKADVARLLATAPTRPTLSSIAGKLADEMGCERTRDASTGVNFCTTHYVGWLSDTDQCARAERLADAVLALLRDGAR